MARRTMTCQTLLTLVSDYVDGDLRDDLCRAIEKHVAECDHCSIVVDTTRKTISLVQACAASDLPLTEDARERLFHRLDLDEYLKRDPTA